MKITRREWLAFTLLTACGRRKTTGYPGYALIATAGEPSLAAVDLTGFRLARQIDLGAPPTAVLAAQERTFALTPSTGSVHVIGTALTRLSSHKLAQEVTAIKLTADQKQLVAIAGKSQELIIADAASFRILHRHKLEAAPVALDLAALPYAAVSTGKHRAIELFHLDTGQRWRAEISGEAGQLRFRSDGQLLLAANLGDRSLVALDVPALRVIADLPLAMQPEHLCFTPDQGQLFISGAGMDGVAIVFPFGTLEVEQTVLVGHDPGAMGCSDNPKYLFVASNSGSDVSILRVDDRRVIGVVQVGEKPGFITVTPDNRWALILDQGSGDLAAIHIPAIRANRTKSGASLFTMLPVGPQPLQAAIVPTPL